jgi:CubicO group peptidase (beta-lactamase class C family)
VTVTQLLNHTSGVPSYTSLGASWARRWGEEMSPDTLVALTAGKPLDFPPGTQWRYNNSGYVVLGMLIEKVTGRSWADDVRSRFAVPLGLPDTRWCDVRPVIPRRAHGYEPAEDGFRNAAFLAMSQPYSAGALCSTVGDLAKWNALLHGGKILSAASYAALTTPQGAAVRGPSGYGFGISPDTLGGRTMLQHGGGIHGFLSENAWFPESGTSVTVLTNATGGNPGKLMRQVARAALGIPLLQPPKRIAMSADAMAKYAGDYDLALPGGARLFTVTLKDGVLAGKLDAPGQGPMELVPFAEHSFYAASNDEIRVVFTASGGRVTGFSLRQGGGTFAAERRP